MCKKERKCDSLILNLLVILLFVKLLKHLFCLFNRKTHIYWAQTFIPLICHSYTYAMYSINTYSTKSSQRCNLGKKYAVSSTIFLLAAYKNLKSCGSGAKNAPGELSKQKHSTSNYRHKSCSVRHRGRAPGDAKEVCTVTHSSLSL